MTRKQTFSNAVRAIRGKIAAGKMSKGEGVARRDALMREYWKGR